MTVGFAVTLTPLLRHFVEVILELTSRGHDVRIFVSEHGKQTGLLPRLRDVPRLSVVDAPPGRSDEWRESAEFLRVTLDYLRYLDRGFKGAVKLRARALRKLVQTATADARTHFWLRCRACDTRHVDEDAVQMLMKGGASREMVRNLVQVLRLAERAMPPDATIGKLLQEHRPDVLLVTPLVNFGSRQADFVKGAKALGIPTMYPVFSWDNLTTKGLVHEVPDTTVVWNDIQKHEVVDLHGVPSDSVRVVGAPRFDTFFGLEPAESYGEFCRTRTLDPTRPTLAYLGSSDFVARGEQAFVDGWLAAVRAHRDLSTVNVIVRPHPREARSWLDWAGSNATGVYLECKPRPGFDDEQALFETLHHSRAAVGLNTSAEIEAGIAGRPVFTLAVPEFEGGQQQAPHFSYLLEPNGGFVTLADSLDEHLSQLVEPVRREPARDRIDAFIERFVRPHGIGQPVAPLFADVVEEAGSGLRAQGSGSVTVPGGGR